MEKQTSWVVDECYDAADNVTIRPADSEGEPDTDVEPIATVYEDGAANLIAAAPDLLAALRLCYTYLGSRPSKIPAYVAEEARAALIRAGVDL